MQKRLLPALATACITAAASSWSADLYVSRNGADSGARDSWASAYTNVHQALGAATAGDTIFLAGQMFILTNELVWSGVNNLSLRGGYEADPSGPLPGNRDSAQWPTILSQTNNGRRVMRIASVSGGVLDQLTLTGGTNVNEGAGLHLTAASGIVMTGCRIIGNLAYAQSTAGGGIWVNNTSSLTMTNCLVRRNGSHATGGNWSSYGGGIFNQGTLRLVDCVVAENNNSLNLQGWERGGALYSETGNSILENCLVYGNTARWEGDGIFLQSGTLALNNCTIAHNGTQGIKRNSGTFTATNSIVWGHVTDITGTANLFYCNASSGIQANTNGNISTDPLFSFGYYLGTGSPARDAGTGAGYLGSAPYTTSVDGTADTGTLDMGYHYTGAADTSMSNLYVAVTGSDANAGTNAAAPLRSLTAALAKARAGSHISVGPGIYTNGVETMPIYITNLNSVTIAGAGAGKTIFHGLGQHAQVMYVFQVHNTAIEDISVTGAYVENLAPAKGGGIYISSASLKLAGCAISNNYLRAKSPYGGGVFVDIGSNVAFTNCLVSDNRIFTSGGNWECPGAGIYNQGYLLLRDCTIKGNNNAIGTVGNEYGGGLYNTHGTAILRNCLVIGNAATDRGDGIYCVSGGYGNSGEVFLENCTVAYNGKEGLYQISQAKLYATNTIVWGHVKDTVGTVSLTHCNISNGIQIGSNGNISADPLFVMGYYLASGSPSRDAGIGMSPLLAGSYTTSLNGEVDSAPVDMGFHYSSAADMSAAYLFVGVDGSDLNGGTAPESPLRSLTAALAKARHGTFIHMGPGHYQFGAESFPIKIKGISGVTIEGAADGQSVVDAAGANARVVELYGVSGAIFRNLAFTGGYLNLGSGLEERAGGVAVAVSSVAFEQCVFSNNYLRTQSALGGGLSIDGGSVVALTRCLVASNTVASRQGNWPSQGAGVYNAGYLTMRECELLNNNNDINNTANLGGAFYNLGNAFLRNCLVARNRATTQGGGIHQAGGALVLENCTVVGNHKEGLNRAVGTASVTNTIFWSNTNDVVGVVTLSHCNTESGYGVGTNNTLNVNPMFETRPDRPYRLQRYSPLVNAGLALPWMNNAVDLAGTRRIEGGRPDMGCFEVLAPRGTALVLR